MGVEETSTHTDKHKHTHKQMKNVALCFLVLLGEGLSRRAPSVVDLEGGLGLHNTVSVSKTKGTLTGFCVGPRPDRLKTQPRFNQHCNNTRLTENNQVVVCCW